MIQQQRASLGGEEFAAEKLPIGWPWRLLIFSLFIFLFSIFIYFGIKFGYGAYLDDQIADLDGKFEELTGVVKVEEQERFVSFYSQLVNLKSILASHAFASNAFSFLERYTLEAVNFTNARQNVKTRVLSLSGLAANLDSLAQQMAVFENLPEVNRLVLTDVGVRASGTTFTMEITWSGDFFRRPVSY